jgi:hypothetical protein
MNETWTLALSTRGVVAGKLSNPKDKPSQSPFPWR